MYLNVFGYCCYLKNQFKNKRYNNTPVYIFTNPSARAGYDSRSIFKRSLTSLNSEFSFSSTSFLTKAEEPSLPYYLPIAGGRIIGFIPFPRVLVLCEMQSVSSRIWIRVADDNHYTTGINDNSEHLQSTYVHEMAEAEKIKMELKGSFPEVFMDYREGVELSWCLPWSNSQWQGWSCGLVHCPGGNVTDPIWRVLASSQGISPRTPLKPQHSNPKPNPLANQL